MLHHLTIQHYALIEQLDIDWENGFSIITGETGAGKSIMLGALNLLLGGRADSKSIQTGYSKCTVEAAFRVNGMIPQSFFETNDIDYDAEECIIRRELLSTGRSRAFINDTPVNANLLRELSSQLIDIHSQHQNLLLQNENFLLSILDTLSANADVKSAYQEAFNSYRACRSKLDELETYAQKTQEEEAYLQFQLQQIEALQLIEGEQKELEAEQNLLNHTEEFKQHINQAIAAMSDSESSIPQQLRTAEDALSHIADKMPELDDLIERIRTTRIELDDILAELENRTSLIEYNPERLLCIEDRLNAIYHLEQKFHVNSVEQLICLAKDWKDKLDQIACLDDDLNALRTQEQALSANLHQAANKLTLTREQAASAGINELRTILQRLGMPHVMLKFQLEPRKEMNSNGADNVKFLFSANKNVPMQDIRHIASGGEMGRLMLALKSVLAKRTSMPTIIFDEIDTGVSGTMAENMAKIMLGMSADCQVICITHLPQIAALGNQHYKVFKEETNDTTTSQLIQLTSDERINEIANMLSGAQITEAAIQNAKTLLGLQ